MTNVTGLIWAALEAEQIQLSFTPEDTLKKLFTFGGCWDGVFFSFVYLMSNFNPKVLVFKGFRLRVTSAGHLHLHNSSALLCFVLHKLESITLEELEINGEDFGIYKASELWWPMERWMEKQEPVSLLQRKNLQLMALIIVWHFWAIFCRWNALTEPKAFGGENKLLHRQKNHCNSPGEFSLSKKPMKQIPLPCPWVGNRGNRAGHISGCDCMWEQSVPKTAWIMKVR